MKKKKTTPSSTSNHKINQRKVDKTGIISKKTSARPDLNTALIKDSSAHQLPDSAIHIVGIGASAGGLEAFTLLIEKLPTNTGMAFVLIQHLDPNHESILAELLSKVTEIPISVVKGNTKVEPNHIYVIPAKMDMIISNCVLKLTPRIQTRGQHMSIDYFFRSLADDQKNRAIGVVLSGASSDGSLGLKAIKAEGGITFAQDNSAKFNYMPDSAIASGCVDFVLSPSEIALELSLMSHHNPYKTYCKSIENEKVVPENENALNEVCTLLKSSSNVDFTHYKYGTIYRRVMRRMVLHKIDNLVSYLEYLKNNPQERADLCQDILINVTSFFRDPGSFESLKTDVLPVIKQNKPAKSPIRVWVPGCSTGEEVYSIAICLVEFFGNEFPIQLFGTDISDVSINKARAGIFSENIRLDVSRERLERFFVKGEGNYRISKFIRDLCVFARQDITRDTPFSKQDLISCRNLMIYLEPVLQKKIVPILHYGLNPIGFLMLGRSETIGTFTNLFNIVDRKHKIYARKDTKIRPNLDFSTTNQQLIELEKVDLNKKPVRQTWSGPDVRKEADRIVMAKYVPPGIVINDDMEIIQFRGEIAPYLEPAMGEPSFNLMKMVRGNLLLELRTAIQEAQRENHPIRKEALEFRYNNQLKSINIEVIPIKIFTSKKINFLILFEDSLEPTIVEVGKTEPGEIKLDNAKLIASERRIVKLEQELTTTKEYLQSIIVDLEAANEDLRVASEEVESSNEELQSTNEELETAKEEMQSTNEELITVNEELQNRNLEFGQANNDLINLLTSVQIPILMLGNDLRVRRFTPIAEKAIKLIPGDVGRLIGDIRLDIIVPDLEKTILAVIDTTVIHEREIQDSDGRWYSLHIRPYKTTENRIEGAVMVLIDIDARKRSLAQTTEARNYVEAIVETVREPLIVLDGDLKIRSANKAFYQFFQISPAETENQFIYEFDHGQWNIPELRAKLEQVLPANIRFQDFPIERDFARIGYKNLMLNARQIYRADKSAETFLLAVDDITERSRLFAIEREGRLKAEAAEQRSTFLAEASVMLAASLDYQTTLAHVPKLSVPNFADWCVIDMIEPDQQILQVEVVHTDPAKEDLLRKLRQDYPLASDSKYGVSNVLCTAKPELNIEITDADLIVQASNDKHLDLLRKLHPRSSLIVPLITRGKVIGAVTFVLSESDRHYGSADLVFAEDLAFRTALAVDNAWLYHEAQEANRVKDEFLATVSHELRTPLTAILGWTRILRKEKIGEDAFIQTVNTIERNANAQAKLIEDLVDVSRIISGKLRLDFSRVESTTVVKTAIATIQPIADAKTVELQYQLAPDVGIIFGDLDRLQQIICNILSNAVKFTPAGGCIKICLEKADSYAKLTISDNGIGISREFLPYVFDRFRQSDNSSIRLHSGLGLGLSIVRHLVELHGGAIKADSQGQGQGSTFTLLFPLMGNHSPELVLVDNLRVDMTELDLKLRGLRALIVDDEPDTLNMLASTLKQYEMEVKTSASVREALAVLEQWLPDVLISDIAMPGESGHELIRKVRLLSLEQGGNIPAIALTSYTRQEDKLKALSAGFQMHLPKPINLDTLKSVIASITGQRNKRGQVIN